MKRQQFVRSLLAIACAGALMHALPAAAQKYPDRPVRIIVPFAVGGPADVFARFIAQRLPDQVGGTFVVENRPGAGAVIGTDQVAKSTPDGYTLGVATVSTVASVPAINPKVRLFMTFSSLIV